MQRRATGSRPGRRFASRRPKPRPPKVRAPPELAVLVVRQSDSLPGQGWWIAGAEAHGYKGQWEGPQASKFIRQLQQKTFDYWAMADIDASG